MGTGSSHRIWKLRAWEWIIAIQYGGRGWKRPAVVFTSVLDKTEYIWRNDVGEGTAKAHAEAIDQSIRMLRSIRDSLSWYSVILEQVRWGAGSTCSRFCWRVIIFLNHHIAIKPINPETAAKHCFASGNEEKETPGRPRFDIISRWNIGRICVNWDSGPVSRKCRLQTGYKMQTRYKMQTES